MSRQKLVFGADGKCVRTPIGELHETMSKAGVKDELSKTYHPHLKVLLKHTGEQPAAIDVRENAVTLTQRVELRWWSDLSVLTVTLEELPF